MILYEKLATMWCPHDQNDGDSERGLLMRTLEADPELEKIIFCSLRSD